MRGGRGTLPGACRDEGPADAPLPASSRHAHEDHCSSRLPGRPQITAITNQPGRRSTESRGSEGMCAATSPSGPGSGMDAPGPIRVGFQSKQEPGTRRHPPTANRTNVEATGSRAGAVSHPEPAGAWCLDCRRI